MARRKTCRHEIEITENDIAESLSKICMRKRSGRLYKHWLPASFLDELKEISEYIKGKKIKKGTELLVWTDYATKAMADVNCYTKDIEDSGVLSLPEAVL